MRAEVRAAHGSPRPEPANSSSGYYSGNSRPEYAEAAAVGKARGRVQRLRASPSSRVGITQLWCPAPSTPMAPGSRSGYGAGVRYAIALSSSEFE